MNDKCSRSKGQSSSSKGHQMYQQQVRYNSAVDGRINFKIVENYRRESGHL